MDVRAELANVAVPPNMRFERTQRIAAGGMTSGCDEAGAAGVELDQALA